MKIQHNNGNECREGDAEEGEAWPTPAVMQVLEDISRVKEIKARFRQEIHCSGHDVRAGRERNPMSLTVMSSELVWRYVPSSQLLVCCSHKILNLTRNHRLLSYKWV